MALRGRFFIIIRSWPGAFLVDRDLMELTTSDGRNVFGGRESWSSDESCSSFCVEWKNLEHQGETKKTMERKYENQLQCLSQLCPGTIVSDT